MKKSFIILAAILILSFVSVSAFTCDRTASFIYDTDGKFPGSNITFRYSVHAGEDLGTDNFNLSECNITYSGASIGTLTTELDGLASYSGIDYFILKPGTTYANIYCSSVNESSPSDYNSSCYSYKVYAASAVGTALSKIGLSVIGFIFVALMFIGGFVYIFNEGQRAGFQPKHIIYGFMLVLGVIIVGTLLWAYIQSVFI